MVIGDDGGAGPVAPSSVPAGRTTHTAEDPWAETRLARIALAEVAEPGHRDIWTRVAAHGPLPVWKAVSDQGSDGGPVSAAHASQQRAREALAHAGRLGARVVIPEDAEWPTGLEDLIAICAAQGDPVERHAAPPLCLWVRGPRRLDEAFARAVAVVGARAATGYGAHVAREIGYGLGDRGWTVVAGGAYGIDAYAHRGALAAGGCTVVVLACGLDRAYPAAHSGLFEAVAEEGLLVSEWAPGEAPFRHRFLIRNRVIAAATAGTVLVEANARSGARQTLRRAGQLSRARMVVPGPVTSAMSVGCHEEVRSERGARLVTGASQVLEDVGRIGDDLAPVPRGPEHPRDRLAPSAQRLLEALRPGRPQAAAEVARRARVPFPEAVQALAELVLQGFAARRADGFVLASIGGAQEPTGVTPAETREENS